MIPFEIPSEICCEKTNKALFLKFDPKKIWGTKICKKIAFLGQNFGQNFETKKKYKKIKNSKKGLH